MGLVFRDDEWVWRGENETRGRLHGLDEMTKQKQMVHSPTHERCIIVDGWICIGTAVGRLGVKRGRWGSIHPLPSMMMVVAE